MAPLLEEVMSNLEHEWVHGFWKIYIDVRLVFKDTVDDYDYKWAPFVNVPNMKDPYADMYRVNETVAITMDIASNILVLLVFVRVLGLARLPSRVVVSLAVVNIVTALSHLLHVFSVIVSELSNTEEKCRMVSRIFHECWALQYNSLTAAMMERILACNTPNFYKRANHILTPAILVGPWLFWTIQVIILSSQAIKYPLGYECTNHLNIIVPDISINSDVLSSLSILLFTLVMLLMTRAMHSHSSGDVWEINRMQFEMRITGVILKIVILNLIFTLPLYAGHLVVRLRIEPSYQDLRNTHFLGQLGEYKGSLLLAVLLTRKEFRRHILLVLEPQDSIRRTRTRNFLIQQPTKPTQSSMAIRASVGSYRYGSMEDRMHKHASYVSMVSGTGTKTVSQPGQLLPVTHDTTSATGGYQRPAGAAESHLVGRDKSGEFETPEWLLQEKVGSWDEKTPNWFHDQVLPLFHGLTKTQVGSREADGESLRRMDHATIDENED